VTGPDEYSALVDNNFYTNRMAALHLKYAARVYLELADRHPNAWEQLASRLQLEEGEVASWLAASESMHLPYDTTLAIDAQDERFLAKPRLELVSSSGAPLFLDYHPLTLYRHQVSKQADLILAMVFAGDGVPVDRLRRNLAYYEAVTTHDSTLSACAYSIVSATAGLPDKALEYFRKAVFVDIDDLHGNVAHGSHMASLAGSVMTIQWGFAGMTWRGGTLGFRPALPKSWVSVTFRMLWRGRLLELEIRQSRVTYTLLQGEPLEICHFGIPFTLDASVDLESPPLQARVT
jgi:alpha,alpha-trehalose phosphorylase